DFGLNAPADPETPEAPTDLTVTPGAVGHVFAHWLRGLRSDRYEVFRKIIGTDPDFVRITTVTGLQATFNTVPSGATVEVEVRGINEAGDGPFSAVRQIVVP